MKSKVVFFKFLIAISIGSLVFLLAGSRVYAQTSIRGKVTDSTGAVLQGATVLVSSSKTATTTNAEGQYEIKAKEGDDLIVSMVGYDNLTVKVTNARNMNITLLPAAFNLDEVVVTALGIQRQSKSLTYSTQEVSGADLTKVPQTNMMNALSGRVAGMTISRSSAGLGGSVKVLLRGNKSANGNNQPLYVIDGVPLTNFARETANASFSMADGGDGISNLNPDDIESLNILKGASAASLYGSQAANGVILITTKKGKSGISKIDFTSNLTVDDVAYKPKLQSGYGETSPGSAESWGAPITNATDNISDFFKKGSTWINSISLSSGTDKTQTYLSYSNSKAKGIVEGNEFLKHNFNIKESASFLDNKLKLDGSANIIMQTTDNNPVFGFQSGPLFGLYTFPRGRDITPYIDQFEVLDQTRNLYVQNWPFITADNQNPYWVINRNLYKIKRNRTLLNVAAKFDLNEWINFQVRGNMDRTNDINTAKYYVGTAAVYAGTNGRYNISNITTLQYYGDAILNIKYDFGDVGFTSVWGTSITDNSISGESSSSNELYIPNVFTIQNMSRGLGTGHSSVSEQHQQLQAVFGNISLSYKNWLYADFTGRNDWSSNLSFTPNGSYFYPSAGITFLLDQLVKLPEVINLAKFRTSYAIVGNTVPVYVTNPVNYLSNSGDINFNNTAPFSDLKPEKTKSFEVGAELKLADNRLNIDFTYYKTNSINQFFSIAVPPGTGYSRRFINGGNIQNSGVEALAGYDILSGKQLGWNTSVNFSANKNVIKALATDIDQFVISDDINNYSSILKVGGSYGDIYGQVLDRDPETGKVLIDAEGRPVVKSGPREFIGNANPDFKLGWNNSFSYKGFSFNMLLDGSFGGKVMSLTEQLLDGYGVSEVSGIARDNGGVAVDGISVVDGSPVTQVDAEKWYKTIGGRQHTTGEYMYDATTIRIREVTIAYSLPRRFLSGGYVKDIKFSVLARNLAYLYKKAPYDPDLTYSTGNGYSGIDVFGLPATRSFGCSVNVSF